MTKFWVSLAVFLIAVGTLGAAVYGFNFNPNLPDYEQRWTFNKGELKQLRINSDYELNIRFEQAEGTENYITLQGEMEQFSIDDLKRSELKQGTLQLKLDTEQAVQLLAMGDRYAAQTMVVALSEGTALEVFQADLDHSNLDAERLEAKKFIMSLDSGNVRIGELAAGTANIGIDYGNLNLDSALVERLTVASNTGNVTIGELQGSRAELISDFGDIEIGAMTGDAVIKADTGNIEVTQREIGQLSVETDFGNVVLTVPQAFRGIYDLKSDFGSVHAPDRAPETVDRVYVRTDSGNITVEQSLQ